MDKVINTHDSEGNIIYLVHERRIRFPNGDMYPRCQYFFLTKDEGFFTGSKNWYDPIDPTSELASHYVVRYVYTINEPINVISGSEDDIVELVRSLHPEETWSGDIFGEDIVDYTEAAFLTQVMGYEGVELPSYYVIIGKDAYHKLTPHAILEFNPGNKPNVTDETVRISFPGGDEDYRSRVKEAYTDEEVISLKNKLGL